MKEFEERYNQLINEIGQSKTMVLSTAYEDNPTSRMMSIVLIGGTFYFQTDRTFRKYKQISNNPKVALCFDNTQIEGIATELGKPVDNNDFIKLYEKNFPSSYKRYSLLEAERLFKVVPTFIQRWLYKEGEPYIERFDFIKEEYSLNKY